MKYKNKFFYLLILLLVLSFCSSEPSQEEIQAQIDAAVEQAVEEALTTTSDESTDKTDESTDKQNNLNTTTPTISVVPAGYYWGQYSDGTWAIELFPDQPDNFKWAWDVFDKEDPSGEYGFDEFDENSTLIGTLVDFDCSFNRISKTEEHKEVFGVSETTIEYYDTYFDWAEDNYYYLTEEAVITISQIMRGVWTCDYDYLESISTEYLDFINSGDAYAELPKFSDYIASFEDNYDDDDSYGKYTYTLGALLYMTPLSSETECPIYVWPREANYELELNESDLDKMTLIDGGLTRTLYLGGSGGGDEGWFGYRFKITSTGIWYSYKYTGHSWKSNQIPDPPLDC